MICVNIYAAEYNWLGPNKISFLHIAKPTNTDLIKSLPEPNIPKPPRDTGIINWQSLRQSSPLEFNQIQLKKEVLKSDGIVKGKGTKDDPYIIKNLYIKGITDKPGILLKNIKTHLIIENVLVDGVPINGNAPARAFGIAMENCEGIVISHCQISRCQGIGAYGVKTQNILFENNYVFSTTKGIMTNGVNYCIAKGNYITDSAEYGVFLYGGHDNVVENNYVNWTGREGIGTNGNSPRQTYKDNIILNTGWTAINLEGTVDNSIVKNNLIVNSYYGIILAGNKSICENNNVFYNSQMGIFAYGDDENMLIKNNLIVGSGQQGINVYSPGTKKVKIISNKVFLSDTGINVNGTGAIIEKNDISQFYWGITVSADACIIKENSIYRGRNAMDIANIPNTLKEKTIIEKNYLFDLLAGITIQGIKNVFVIDNKIKYVGQGISIYNGLNLTIRNNKFIQIPYLGIELSDSYNCLIIKNKLVNGTSIGITIEKGEKNIIRDNNIVNFLSESLGGGIIIKNTKDNIITDNRLEKCVVAVVFDGGKNQNNILRNNSYVNNQLNIGTQEGAEKVKETNNIEGKPISRN